MDPQPLDEGSPLLLHATPPTPPCPAMSLALNSFFLYASSPSPWFSCCRLPFSPSPSHPPKHHPAMHRLWFLSSDFSLRLNSPPERTLACCALFLFLLSPPASSEWPSGCRAGYGDWLTPHSLGLLQQNPQSLHRKLWVLGKQYLLHSLKKKKNERQNLETISPPFLGC